jgi:DNA-binding response OmpR family regulator
VRPVSVLVVSSAHSRSSDTAPERALPRILLVEDDPDVRMIIEHVLLRAGYAVDTTGTMTGGTDLIRCRSYDLVVADGKLPDGTGMDVCDAAAEKGIKCLIVTGYAFSLPAGAADRYEILLKPMRPAEMIAAVERVLRE